MREAHGLMVNYRYEPKEIERNHEAYANEGIVAASRTVRGLLKLKGKARAIAADPETPALPPPLPETAKT
jgi:malonyl-CoA decarboxylase